MSADLINFMTASPLHGADADDAMSPFIGRDAVASPLSHGERLRAAAPDTHLRNVPRFAGIFSPFREMPAEIRGQSKYWPASYCAKTAIYLNDNVACAQSIPAASTSRTSRAATQLCPEPRCCLLPGSYTPCQQRAPS